MKRLLLLLFGISLFYISPGQKTAPVMTGSVTGQKVLSDRKLTFNVGSSVPYLYNGGSSTKLQVGFPYNVLYMDKTFPGELFVSKGYFADQIQIRWEVSNNASLIDHFEIFRKKISEKDSMWVDNVEASGRKWEDFYAEANEIYKYTVIAKGIPGEQRVGYTRIEGIGFRTPLATITGRVSFTGGNGVKNVVVTASTTDKVPTHSIHLNPASYLKIPQNSEVDFSGGFTFQAYLKFSSTGDAAIFSKSDNLQLVYTSGKFVFKAGSQTVELPYVVPTNTYMHISAVFTGDSAMLYIPSKITSGSGQQTDTLYTAKAAITNTVTANSNTILLGKRSTLDFNGYIDEVRIWKRALPREEILRDYNRTLIGREEGFFAYLRMNEGFGNLAYDISKAGSYFNEHHAEFMESGVSWSLEVPTIEQLGNRGITDEEGNYIIAGIPFLTDGSPYKFTPMLAPHEFDPGYRILFLSEDAVVHNNTNFTDISAFNVNGSVVYRNTTLGVKGVQILIDGQPTYGPDTKPETTDELGRFEIQVPIGSHFISLKKEGHVFDNGGRWPYHEEHSDSIERHSFNQNLTLGKPFIDTTLVTVIGRVIGGTSSNNTPMGFEQSDNNIGKATLTLNHRSDNPELTFKNLGDALGDQVISYPVVSEIDDAGSRKYTTITHKVTRADNETMISTSAASGEFMAKLIPEKFSIVGIDVDNDGENEVKNFFGNRVIDLSTNPALKKEYSYDKEGELLDSIMYHVKLNYIYQTLPDIKVTNVNDTELFHGETIIPFTNPVNGESSEIVVANHFRYPVFEMFRNYSPKISVFESYLNFDTDEETHQSVKEAEIQIINNLALDQVQKVYRLTPEMDGVVIDTFKVGLPNITKSENDHTSFTKSMEVNVTVDGNTYPWEPGGQFYRAYIIGQRPKGNNFYTQGQQFPEIILRDPPGSTSSAYIEKGSKYSVSSKFSTNFENGSGFGLEILLGCEAAAGGGLAGPVIKTENKNSGKTNLSFSTSIANNGEYVQTYEFTERVETSNDPGMVGSMADIYIGKSYNYFYGETDNLKIVPRTLAENNGIVALGSNELNNDAAYTLGIVEGFIMNPDNSDTYFKYTQSHILSILLPEIESRRNNLFLTSRRSDGLLKYTSNSAIPGPEDIRYAVAHSYSVETTANDTIVHAWYKMTDTDSIESYSFRPERVTIEDLNNILDDSIFEIDSIRYYNTQIGIWIDAIRLNESEKAAAITNNVLEQNISFDGGVGSVSRKEIQTISYKSEETRTKKMNFGAQGSVGFLFNKMGVVGTGELKIAHELGVGTSEEFTQTMEYGYTLSDGNVGDYHSVNVYRRPQNGIFNAEDLQETKMEMPSGFDFGILGAAGGAIGAGAVLVGALAGYFTTVSTAGAAGGAAILGTAATMAIAAGLSYIPYVSCKDEVLTQGELFSPGDFKVSSFDISSPIFSTLGGATMCPYERMEHTFFYRKENGDSVVLHKATMQREKPDLTAEPAEVFNVPSTEPAIFYVKLANNSETGESQWYALDLDEASNQKGALVLIDGEFSQKLINVPANTTITKLVTVQGNNPAIMDYDSIGLIMHSTCQFDPTDFMPEIADTAYISAHFQAACTSAEILEPLDNWVINVLDKDTMTVRIGNYNLAHDSFQSFRFEYKPASGSIWVPVKYFVNDPALANKDDIPDTLLIHNQPSVTFDWSMSNLKDRAYQIRVVSYCTDLSENESLILTGILDGLRPQVFGSPQPADGILNVDENISIQFNEPIEGSLLNEFNFDLKGTLNYFELKHEAYLELNGLSDYGVIPEGISFNNKSFTVECWIRPEDYGNSVILSQGYDPASSLEIGLRDGYKTYLKMGGSEWDAPLEFSDIVTPADWQHLAWVYDYENGDVFIYHNDNIILEVRGTTLDYNNSGKIFLGKSPFSSDLFQGNIHDLRIWSKFITRDDVYAQQYKVLTGNEVGLYGYWPLDEAFGMYGIDKAASRHMEIHAQWQAYPGGVGWNFANSNFLTFATNYFAIIPEMDYTLEFWFKADHPQDTVCLFSNQKGNGRDGAGWLERALSIYATPDGEMWVNSKGYSFMAVPNDYFDNSWHHFALVLRRRGNVTSYIDGEVQNERENTILGGIAGGQMALGARKWDNINGTVTDRYFLGKLDEFRLWDLAKTKKQIQMDMNSKLYGNETGLLVYFPFEAYHEDDQGFMSQTPTLRNFVDEMNVPDAVPVAGNTYTTDAPHMKDTRPSQSIAYDFVYSEDKIIINPKSYYYPLLEKNTIEITVQDVEDKFGNSMASPETWLAWVHRNQVRWEDESRTFAKEVYAPLEFVATIKNSGGLQVGYTLENLPFWLTARPSAGSINPESTVEISFTVNPALNIGEYQEDIILRTENGFDEKLSLTLRVYKTPPDWKIDPSRFEASMNFVGKIKVNGVFSTDLSDMVAAFKQGTDSIRGVARLRYIEEFDSYLVFLTAYGTTGEPLEFQIWDASAGLILDKVLPTGQLLTDHAVVGTTLAPVIFESTGNSRHHIILEKGWNWVSFNKNSPLMSSLSTFFWALEPSNKDIVKTQNGYSQYSGTSGNWSKGLTSISYLLGYQIMISKLDTIVFGGTSLIPENTPIPVNTGWNYIGYIPDLTMDVREAMRLFTPRESDIIKSQDAFAMFDSRTGWLGTLEVMQPGEGYMLKVNGSPGILTYPNSTLLKSSGINRTVAAPPGWDGLSHQYESNLSVVARLDFSQVPEVLQNGQMILGAFINGKCHGFSSSLDHNGLDYDPYFLNISNNMQGEMIGFRVFDGLTGNFYTVKEKKPYVGNGVFGTIREPLLLTLEGLTTGGDGLTSQATFRCYPNPFENKVVIEFSGFSGKVTIDVINATGTLVKNIYNGEADSGLNTLTWDGTNGARNMKVAAGLYTIRLVSENRVETMKITKLR